MYQMWGGSAGMNRERVKRPIPLCHICRAKAVIIPLKKNSSIYVCPNDSAYLGPVMVWKHGKNF